MARCNSRRISDRQIKSRSRRQSFVEFFSLFRAGGRVVDCARLESVCTSRYRGFESPPARVVPMRVHALACVVNRFERSSAVSRSESYTINAISRYVRADGRTFPPCPPPFATYAAVSLGSCRLVERRLDGIKTFCEIIKHTLRSVP